jgi:RNA polymerase sigma factor for flagellar operon FliA
MGDERYSEREGDPLSEHLAVVQRIVAFICRRSRLAGVEAEDFESFVTVKLLEDNAARLRQFAGRSSIQTFLSIVIERLFVDYGRLAWGKWRPSSQALRLGPTAVLIEQLTVRDRHSHDEAYQLLTTNHQLDVSRLEFDGIVAQLPVRAARQFESDVILTDVASTAAGPDQVLLAAETDRRQASVKGALQQVMAGLPVQDRLVLTMRFLDGRTVVEIAAALGLDQKPLYRHVDRLLRDLRQRLEATGVDAQLIADVFARQDGPMRPEESRRMRPSMERRAGPWR